jgi:hypothetical protein
MTPQDTFMIVAPIRAGALADVRAVLATMTPQPGTADPDNAVFPFRAFATLHVARFLIIDDQTLDDRNAYPGNAFSPPPSLAFLGDCDGSADAFLDEAATRAPRLAELFRHCEEFDGSDLRGWMQAHSVRPATSYVNWVGRSVRQVHEETALHDALRAALPTVAGTSALERAQALRHAVRMTLTREAATPVARRITMLASFLSLPVLALLLLPVLVAALPAFLLILRQREQTDPVIVPRVPAVRVAALSVQDDHDVTNAFSAVGSLKPGRFRLYLTKLILWVVNWSTRHIYVRGRLARVGTIHFARWVFLDDRARLFFASNYDGSLDSYMDDFINKVAFGLNLVFSNGIGYPKTDFLVIGGARREQDFKAFLRRHQILTDVWYKAYPGRTTYDLARSHRVRLGYEQGHIRAADAARWLAEVAA